MVVHFYFDMLWNGFTLYLHLCCKLVILQWYEQAQKPVASCGCLENQVNYYFSRETWSRAKWTFHWDIYYGQIVALLNRICHKSRGNCVWYAGLQATLIQSTGQTTSVCLTLRIYWSFLSHSLLCLFCTKRRCIVGICATASLSLSDTIDQVKKVFVLRHIVP